LKLDNNDADARGTLLSSSIVLYRLFSAAIIIVIIIVISIFFELNPSKIQFLVCTEKLPVRSELLLHKKDVD
jgi:hypothetical protein